MIVTQYGFFGIVHSSIEEAILTDNHVKPLLLDLLDTSTLSKVPQLVPAGMQWLSKTPAVTAAGRFKDLVLAAELMQGTFLFASLVLVYMLSLVCMSFACVYSCLYAL